MPDLPMLPVTQPDHDDLQPRPVPGPAPRDMVWIPGGTLRMGSDAWYPEERPVHSAAVDGFWMDDHQVTVAEYRRFIKATGYQTLAQRPLDPAMYPDADPTLLVPGASSSTRRPVPSTCATTATGGHMCPAPAGTIPKVPTAISPAATVTR